MSIPTTVRWIGLALLGILIAGGISVAASRLASQQIGLASEPLTAGDALAPPAPRGKTTRQPAPSARHHRSKATRPSATAPPATTTAPPPGTTLPPATTPPAAANPPAPGEESGQAGEGGDGGGGDD